MVVKSSGHEESLGKGSVEKLMIVEKEIAQVTSLIESTKPSNKTAEEKGATALNSSNTTYADSLVFSDLSEDSISTPKNSPSPPRKASSPLPPPPCPVSDTSLSQVPPNNSLLGMLPLPHKSVPFLSQPVIPSQHGILFPPAMRTPQIQQPPPNSQLPLHAPYISSYVPQQGSWGWAQPLNAPVFHQPQMIFRHNVPLLSNFALSSAHPVPTRQVPTLCNRALASKAVSKKITITAPTNPTTTTSLSPSRSLVQTPAASKTLTTATSTNQSGTQVQTTAAYNTSTTATSTNQSGTQVQTTAAYNTSTTATSTNQSGTPGQTTIASKTSTSWETTSGGNQSSDGVQQSNTINDTKLSTEVKTSQSTPSISQPSTIASQSSISHQPAVSTPQPPVSQPNASRPPPLYSRVAVKTLPKSCVGLGRGKSLATLSPPSPRSVGVGRGHSTIEGWHTIRSRRNPITTPESFPPIGSGAGLDII